MSEAQTQAVAVPAQPAAISKDVPSFLPLSFDPNLLGPPGPPGAPHSSAARQQQQPHGVPGRPPMMPRMHPAGFMQPGQQHMQHPLPGGPGPFSAGQQGMPPLPPGMMHPQQQQQMPPGMFMPPGGMSIPPEAAGAAAGAAAGWPGGPPGFPVADPYGPMAAAADGAGMYPAAAAAHKRRRRDAPPLDAEAQLLLLGFLSAVVGDSNTLNQCLISAVGLETQIEQQRRAAVAAGLVPPSAPPPKLGVLGSYKLAQKLANELRARPALSMVWQLQLTLDAARR